MCSMYAKNKGNLSLVMRDPRSGKGGMEGAREGRTEGERGRDRGREGRGEGERVGGMGEGVNHKLVENIILLTGFEDHDSL